MTELTIYILDHIPFGWRDYLFGLKRFKAGEKIYPRKQALIFFTEKGKWHGGFADRMKGIISLFHFCLIKQIEFRINYSPFDLSDFLMPNEYNWHIEKKNISFHRKEAKFINLIANSSIKRLINLKTKKQIHAFANRDVVDILNVYYKTNYTWGELFKTLFKPTEELLKQIDVYKSSIGGNYICAVFRFQNLLDDFKEYDFQPLNKDKQLKLIEKCKNAVAGLQQKENKKMLVTSDSITFLQYVVDIPGVYAFPNKVIHIDRVENEQHSVYMKSFLDFFLLSEGQKIYAIGTNEMYKSEFPMYAAKVNNIPFERILIE